ncbi:unnamed protein product [Prorocentrum cordatum]|uniref:Uncharacterized protein n=1 Tax=Prorocentrum cordatum TaxID=2364126 RepID=A0ABN9UXG3_9DINO|nr:unnamed protein product [Polarella glacialis]
MEPPPTTASRPRRAEREGLFALGQKRAFLIESVRGRRRAVATEGWGPPRGLQPMLLGLAAPAAAQAPTGSAAVGSGPSARGPSAVGARRQRRPGPEFMEEGPRLQGPPRSSQTPRASSRLAKGKRARRKARAAAAAWTGSPARGDRGSGRGSSPASSGGGSSRQSSRASDLERLTAHLEASPRLDAVADAPLEGQLASLRGHREKAAAEQARHKEAELTPADRLRRAANLASKAERKAAAARRALEAADQAVASAERAVQAAGDQLEEAEERRAEARERLAELETAAAAAKSEQERMQIFEADLQAVRGLFLQLRTLPSARQTGNFADAWRSTMQQLEAVDWRFADRDSSSGVSTREHTYDSSPLDVDEDSDVELMGELAPASERGQAERRGSAAGVWPQVPRSALQELMAEASDLGPLATAPPSRAAAPGGRLHQL